MCCLIKKKKSNSTTPPFLKALKNLKQQKKAAPQIVFSFSPQFKDIQGYIALPITS